MENKWELTDEERDKAFRIKINTVDVAQAQAKKLVEKYSNPLNCVHSQYAVQPHMCPDCWQELRRQVGI